jgi:protein tyrosine phosphatase
MNSSLINGFGPDSGMFIATQAPIKFTTNSFWQLVWENDVPLIIMGCNLIEDDVEKCSPYFPEEEKVTTEDFEVFLIRTQTRFPNLIERKLLLTNPSSAGQRFITHVQFTAWPDLSVPNLNEDFAGIRFLIEKIERKWKKFNGKILVHCSAGVGRTGVIIAIYNMIAEIRAQGTLSVFKTVRVLREQRWGMVATEEQYGFIYRFMEHWVSAYLLQTANEH